MSIIFILVSIRDEGRIKPVKEKEQSYAGKKQQL